MRAFILFPSLFAHDPNVRYKQVALWLCNRYSLICHNVRDIFSAGGMVAEIHGEALQTPCPKIVGKLIEYIPEISQLLQYPDADILNDIAEFWDFNCSAGDLYRVWKKAIEYTFAHNPKLAHFPIANYL